MDGKVVEAKKRKWGIRINNSDNITLKNIHVKAASMKVDNSDHLHVTNSSFQYLHPFLYRRSYGVLKEGIMITNSDNGVYENNLIAHTWGSGFIVDSGNNNKIHNNIIEDIGWLGQFTVSLFNEADNTVVTQNTFGKAARSHIRATAPVKSIITDNHMFEAMAMGEDAGAIMMTSTAKADYLDLKNTEIAYNHIHDIYGIPAMDTSPIYNRQTVVAFYMEDVANYTVHHNLVYNLSGDYSRSTQGAAVQPDGKVVYLGPRNRNMPDKVNYYNNTFYNYDGLFSLWHHDENGQLGRISNGDVRNNIVMAGKVNKINAKSTGLTYPKIEVNNLTDFFQQLTSSAYNYFITEANNSELAQEAFNSEFEDVNSGNFRLTADSEQNANGEFIEGITGNPPIARGAWEGSTLVDKDRVLNAGANISRDDFPVSH
ncbi:right-handed parallel beta-helix repeat-containing protein [Paraglaciecola aquimarina]|uniref:Right-handed parallel beta-helix repeat-containing protein n=1 Tax=Paraglaciecola aquimarina TaxID=1235557 RepID=A0ABU3SX52_9ALTE|nr:right-handed parallel beta-helix repeat-containing protein [Paraglaciecola aquimarina]MDU0354578.1 right-handed parallel beta-helix repeat-containing protein [Paraglaciecola aquimarina]